MCFICIFFWIDHGHCTTEKENTDETEASQADGGVSILQSTKKRRSLGRASIYFVQASRQNSENVLTQKKSKLKHMKDNNVYTHSDISSCEENLLIC